MNYWEVLGLPPGQDAAAIKKAYAAKLRITRPDEDAAAYQRLREAFDAAMTHAKGAPQAASFQPQWSQPAAPPGPPPADAPNQARADEEAAPAAAAAAKAKGKAQWPNATAQPPVPAIDLAELVKETLELWKKQGDAALLAHWPQLRNVLGECSLPQAQACSTAFAQMILGEAKLPRAFIDELRQFFGWGSDYRRMPQLAGHHAVEFKRRLAEVAQQLYQQKMKVEQDRLDAIREAERARAAARELDAATRKRLPLVPPFARMLANSGSRAGKLFAFLVGPLLIKQWSGLTKEQRVVLGINYLSFADGIAACKAGSRLRGIVGLAVLLCGLLVSLVRGVLPAYAALAALALGLCYFLPLDLWQERLRARYYPARLRVHGVAPERLSQDAASKSNNRFFVLAFALFVVGLLKLIPFAFLAYRWFFRSGAEPAKTGVVVPVFIVCVAACRAAGTTNLLTLISLASLWYAVVYWAIEQKRGWIVPLLAVACTAIVYLHGLNMETAPTVVPLGLLAPWLVFMLARRESPALAIGAAATAMLSQPFPDPGLLALWVAAVTVAAGCMAALMPWCARLVAKRYASAEPC